MFLQVFRNWQLGGGGFIVNQPAAVLTGGLCRGHRKAGPVRFERKTMNGSVLLQASGADPKAPIFHLCGLLRAFGRTFLVLGDDINHADTVARMQDSGAP